MEKAVACFRFISFEMSILQLVEGSVSPLMESKTALGQ
jgi:hypothetical protein